MPKPDFSLPLSDGKLYVAGPVAGTYLGDAIENIREGFRVIANDFGSVREDDA